MEYSWFIIDGDVSNCPAGKAIMLPRILSWILLHCTGKHEAAGEETPQKRKTTHSHSNNSMHKIFSRDTNFDLTRSSFFNMF